MLRAAIALADEGGLEAITMRRLARSLGVEAMSLYYYVANKDDILDGIADIVVREIELPDPGGDWKAAIRASAISAHEVLQRHPWACALLMSAARVQHGRLRMIEALLGCLRDAGFGADLTDRAYHAIDGHILGFTLWEAGYASGSRAVPADFATTFLRDLSVEEYPNMAEHVAFHLRPPDRDRPSGFEFGLDLILDGLERARDAS